MSRIGSPGSRRRRASLTWWDVSLDGRPIFTPRALARARPSPCPHTDQLALKLGQPAQHRQHEATVQRRGIGPTVTEGTKAGLAVGDPGQGVEKVPCRLCQPVEPG